MATSSKSKKNSAEVATVPPALVAMSTQDQLDFFAKNTRSSAGTMVRAAVAMGRELLLAEALCMREGIDFDAYVQTSACLTVRTAKKYMRAVPIFDKLDDYAKDVIETITRSNGLTALFEAQHTWIDQAALEVKNGDKVSEAARRLMLKIRDSGDGEIDLVRVSAEVQVDAEAAVVSKQREIESLNHQLAEKQVQFKCITRELALEKERALAAQTDLERQSIENKALRRAAAAIAPVATKR